MVADAQEGEAGWARIDAGAGAVVLTAGGDWTIDHAGPLYAVLQGLAGQRKSLTIDLTTVGAFDTTGAWLIHRARRRWRDAGGTVETVGLDEARQTLLHQVAENDSPCPVEPSHVTPVLRQIQDLGEATDHTVRGLVKGVNFLGRLTQTMLVMLVLPNRWRLTPLVYHMEHVGLKALPIVGLISFLIGVVIAYQGAEQLRRFGAEIFVVNLVAVSIVREIGILLTAIVVAGRSGSAFTAEIGSMKLHEEIDAMRTIGIDPVAVLAVPRVLALMIMMPLLTFWGDIMGLLGGGLMCWVALDISPGIFLERVSQSVDMWSFWVGIIKAPVFAAVIATCGCYEGMQVSGGAESVGQRTTKSVVESIFLVIVLDALFSIFFALVGV
jgi:phospholipid/cholesterol/gamma-HCH transport system permease protein